MAALGDIYFKKETLETLLKGINAKSEKGISIVFSINDETTKYGQNVSAYVSQTKEQQEAKKEKFYVGNGRVFWLKDGIKVAEKKTESNEPTTTKADDTFDLF
jgi:hypothetical protein